LKLARSFEAQLSLGALKVGDRLPSVRDLCKLHRVSVATAVGCYSWLERQGYVRARPKSGFYVSRLPITARALPAVVSRNGGPAPVRVRLGSDGDSSTALLDLGPAIVAPSLLPMARLNRSLRLALSAFSDAAVRYEDPRGNPRLRRQIARLVFRQGGTCSPSDILVTSGATEAWNLSIRAVARAGDVVVVESPGCYEILQALEALGIHAVEVPHGSGRGPDPDVLKATIEKYPVKAILLTATCHNPTGECMSDAAKQSLVAFATERDLPIIEGDAFGDLVFEGERPRPLKAFDRTGIVLQCSSLAHYVAPGFNLGWSNAGRWQADVARIKQFANPIGASLPQLALAEFLESGSFEKHLRRLRVLLWESVDASRQEILRTFPAGTRVSRPQGGFVVWVQLPDGYDGLEVQRGAAALGIRILPGCAFSPSGRYSQYVRISCGHPFAVLQPALRKLASLLTSRQLRSA
jgi:DNA-binding transcriptional MocR family regulator